MSILSKNLKSIRLRLQLSQKEISRRLGVGFRSYVRYEAGERDAPLTLLSKISRLGGVTIDRLLAPQPGSGRLRASGPDISFADMEQGRLIFRGMKKELLFTQTGEETSFLNLFRMAGKNSHKRILKDMENRLKTEDPAKHSGRTPRKIIKARNVVRLKRLARTIRKITVKG